MDSLWGEEFNVEEKIKTKKVIDKIKKTKESKDSLDSLLSKSSRKKSKLDFKEQVVAIKEAVYRVLGKQIENVSVIRDKSELHDYLVKGLEFGRISIDTETNNSLDPITCKLMGLCLYVKGQKQVYIPVNHVNPDTRERLENQLTENDIHDELSWLMENKGKCIFVFHNGKFDYQVIKCTSKVELDIDWDTLIGAKLLDENEKSAGLKQQYIDKIDPDQEKYSIENLFEKLEYSLFDPELFALYAATDAYMTDRLYEWQMDKFNNPNLSRLSQLAYKIEMPVVKVIAEMELAGMEVDLDYAKLLSDKFHKRLDAVDKKIEIELEALKPQIEAWRLTPQANFRAKLGRTKTVGGIQFKYQSDADNSYWYEAKTGRRLDQEEADTYGLSASEQKSKSEQLEDPINLGSPTQLAILFYDVLKCPVVDTKKPRATGEDALIAIQDKLHLELCKHLLDRRELVKLLTTYIDTIPELSNRWEDHRVRTHFNQCGAATGRLSSSDPLNFQNIPSSEKTIRMLFKAKDGYRIIGGDFQAQEPRLTAFMSQDPSMIKAYAEGKDLYSVIASMSFNRSYEDCLEFYPEGTEIEFEGQLVKCGYKTHQNKEGKKYRSMAKSILLGIEYGRGAASVGEQIGKSKEEAQKIIDEFFDKFPKVKDFIDSSIRDAHEKGYVEDVAGRRRRLPDAQLPRYTIKDLNTSDTINPFLICEDNIQNSKLIDKYNKLLQKVKNQKDYEKIQSDALKENIEIHSNTGFIAQAERQAVNSRIQGGAATLTKCALLSLFRDKRLRDIGGYLINTVHDEILLEVPEEHSKEAEEILKENMINSAKDWVTNVSMGCDCYNVNCWYIDEYVVLVENEYKHLLEEGLTPENAFEKECENRCESTRSQIYEIVKGYLGNYIPEGVDTSYKSFSEVI